jgi:malonate decarboxylase delta subunit
MEKIDFEYPAGEPAIGRILTGVVGSGDLEVLLEPNVAGVTTVSVTTSVDGFRRVWESLLTRVFTAVPLPASRIEIHDFGATPGVVRMRIEQAFEELNEPSQK